MKIYTLEEVGIYRILFFICLFLVIPIDRIADYATIPDWKMCENLAAGYWLSFRLSEQQAQFFALLTKITILSSAVGFVTAYSYWILFVSISVLLVYWSQFCYTTHELTPIPLAILLWAILDKSSGYRLDFLWKKQTFFVDKVTSSVITFQQIHFCLIFFSAALSKLITSGTGWVSGLSLKNILLMQNFLFEGAWLNTAFPYFNNWIVSHPMFCFILAFFSLAIEFLSPLALYKKTSLVIVSGLAILQLGILTVVYINFITWLPLYIFWISVGPLNRYINSLKFVKKI